MGVVILNSSVEEEPPPPPPPVISPSGSSFEEIIRAIYDPVAMALRVINVGAPGSTGTRLSTGQIWKSIYDSDNNAIRVVYVTGSVAGGKTPYDYDQVMRTVYDRTRQALRLRTALTAVPTGKLSAYQIMQRVFYPANSVLRVVDLGISSESSGTRLDWRQVIDHSFDETRTMLKVVTPDLGGGGSPPDPPA